MIEPVRTYILRWVNRTTGFEGEAATSGSYENLAEWTEKLRKDFPDHTFWIEEAKAVESAVAQAPVEEK